MTAKTIKIKLTLAGHGVVQTAGDEKSLSFRRDDVNGQKYENVVYAKGNYVPAVGPDGKVRVDDKGVPRLRKILKISGDGLRHAVHAAAMPAHTPNILLSPEARVHFLASADTLLRGWLATSTEERKRSAYALTSAEDPNAVLTVEMFSNSAPKVSKDAQAENEDGTIKSDTSLFARETTGNTNYNATGFIDIDELRFISVSDIYGRRAVSDDVAEAYRRALSANLGSEVDKPRYWRRRDGASSIPERGILLTDAQVQHLVTYLLKRMSEIRIVKSQSGYASTTGIAITVLEGNRLGGDEIKVFDGAAFDVSAIPAEYNCIWDEVTEEQGRAEVQAFVDAIAAERKSKADADKKDKAAKATAKKAGKSKASDDEVEE